MIPTWVILTPLAAVGLHLAARCWLRRRRDRACAAGIARRVRERAAHEAAEIHDRTYLQWLDGQFDSKGRAR